MPSAPVSPFYPLGSTRLSAWLGASPVIVAEAVSPEETVPIESVLAGPAAPCAPSAPAPVTYNVHGEVNVSVPS